MKRSKWITLEDDTCVIVMPETDIKPHGFRKGDEKSVELAGMNCPCNPRMITGTALGPYKKPMIVHNSFEDSKAIDEAIKNLLGEDNSLRPERA